MSRQNGPRPAAKIGAACVASAATLWGLWPIWVRRGGEGGARAATVALCAAGALSLPGALRAAAGRDGRPARAWALLAALGLSNAANTWSYFRALAEGAVAPAALTHYLAPVLVALAAPLLLGEPRSPRTPLALALALAGTGLLLARPGADAAAGDARAAAILGAISALFYATNVIVAKRAGRWFSDVELFAASAVVAAAALAPATGLPAGAAGWAWPAAGGLISALFAGLLYYAGLRRIPAERAGVLTYLEIPSAVVVAWFAFGERPEPLAALGGLAILGAGYLVVTAPVHASARQD